AGPAPRARGRLPLRRRRPRRAAVNPASLVAIGAALLVASYPPFRLPLLSFVAVAPAIVLVRRLEPEGDTRGALRWGFAYGVVTQGAVLYWLVVALWHFTPLSALGYLATIAIFGLWYGLLFWFVLRVRGRLWVRRWAYPHAAAARAGHGRAGAAQRGLPRKMGSRARRQRRGKARGPVAQARVRRPSRSAGVARGGRSRLVGGDARVGRTACRLGARVAHGGRDGRSGCGDAGLL